MPSNKYKRNLRNTFDTSTKKYITVTPITSTITSTRKSDLLVIQEHFYTILDNIIQYNDLTTNISLIHDIIYSTQSVADYYKIINIIENNILSVISNISYNNNSDIINMRLDYIKSYIEQIPQNCQILSPLSDTLLEFIDSFINNIDFTVINNNIQQLHSIINYKYVEVSQINRIQDILLSIVSNIEYNTPTDIINDRIEYVRYLISEFSLFFLK